MASKPVDVMVVNFNTAGLLQPMFDALRRAGSERLASYLVVDNASRDDSVQRMAQVCPEALLLSNKQNVGFGRANNQLLAHLKGKYALLLNTDAFVAAVQAASTPQLQVGAGDTVGMVVPQGANWLVNVVRDGRIQVNGRLQGRLESGAVGGNLLFIDSHGFAVGPGGRVDAGRLVFAAPSTGPA